MRKALERFEHLQTIYIAIVQRTGLRRQNGKNVPTVCLNNLSTSKGEPVSDHIWVDITDVWTDISLKEGTYLVFGATCRKYHRGYFGNEPKKATSFSWDYGLTNAFPLIAFHPSELQ